MGTVIAHRSRVVVVLTALALVLTACSGSSGGSGGKAAPSPSPAPSATVAPSTTASPTTTTTTTPTPTGSPVGPTRTQVSVYFLRREHVEPVARTVAAATGVGAGAVRALLAGPTRAERRAGLSTAVPEGVALRGLTVRSGVATVDLSQAYASGGGTLSMSARLAQVVFTLTRFPTVRAVSFRLDGRPVSTFSGEGIVLSHPSTRADFEELSPAILIETPLPAAVVRSPLRVAGTADVFEAVLQLDLRVLGEGGKVLVTRTVHATSGTGTRGTFAAALPFTVTRPTDAVLTGFVRSAKDGTRQDVMSVVVRLTP